MPRRIARGCLSVLLLIGVSYAGSRNLRDEFKSMAGETGVSVAMFDRGEIVTATGRYPTHENKETWHEVEIPGAVGHSWDYGGMVSPDGTLAAFRYWPVNPCPSGWRSCDTEAPHHYYLTIGNTDGSGVRQYPNIALPSQMCWAPDNSKIAMLARMGTEEGRQFIVLDLDSGKIDRIADGKRAAVTPQCWSPDGKQLTNFLGDEGQDRPGAIRILDIATRESP